MTTTTTLMTAEELLVMPDDGFHRYELVKGELITMAPAGAEHGAIGSRACRRIGTFIESNDFGEVFNSDTGFIISTDLTPFAHPMSHSCVKSESLRTASQRVSSPARPTLPSKSYRPPTHIPK